MTDLPRIQARLQALRDNYAEQLPAKIGALRTLWEQLRSMPSPDDLKTLQSLVHSLTGSGATFGYAKLSDAARILEVCLKDMLQHGGALDTVYSDRVNAYLQAIESAALAASVNLQNILNPGLDTLSTEAENRLVYLVEDDLHLGQELSQQIRNFGYEVRTFADPQSMKTAFLQELPAVLIMDIMFPQGKLYGTETISELKCNCENLPPVIYISARDDLPARLAAVRASSSGYFTKPVNVTALIDMLDRLSAQRVAEAYRIMIVDDDKALADHYALSLRQAHMEVVTINDPLDVLSQLSDFNPDLILMDVYMPECDGLELAAVLRQQPNHDSIPIVFLSTDVDADLRTRALRLGADDFLHKPILPNQLIISVSSRAQRARLLRAHMIHDGLTGLLNHSALKEYFHREFIGARRRGAHLAYAILDLDHFKAVNDTFGHASGDRVLKSLARILQQRLRKSDFIGRIGGEEFAVVFTDTSAANAVRLMEEIRAGFSLIKHCCEAQEFYATFSCGLATVENGDDPAAIYQVADRALYEAKRAGRNRVVIAQGKAKPT